VAAQLKEIAPEHYETLAFHKSWTWVTWKFLTDPDVGPWTRMRRPTQGVAPATPADIKPVDKAAAQVRSTAWFVFREMFSLVYHGRHVLRLLPRRLRRCANKASEMYSCLCSLKGQ
jgi:hypothetical protein